MPLMSEFPFRRVYFSPAILERLPPAVREAVQPLIDATAAQAEVSRSLVVLHASEVIREATRRVPAWVDSETSYLIVADVPEPALLQLPTILRIHKPDQRLHVTRDADAAKRQAIALVRDLVFEGIVDAYALWDDLYVILGDMSIRSFHTNRLPFLEVLDERKLRDFSIHPSGSYLHWPGQDLRVGASQLLQAVDPMFLADVMIARYELEKTSLALRVLRGHQGLAQSDIPGLSARHVRRLEKEEVRLTADAATKYARAFGTTLSTFLETLAECIERLNGDEEEELPDQRSGQPELRHVS